LGLETISLLPGQLTPLASVTSLASFQDHTSNGCSSFMPWTLPRDNARGRQISDYVRHGKLPNLWATISDALMVLLLFSRFLSP